MDQNFVEVAYNLSSPVSSFDNATTTFGFKSKKSDFTSFFNEWAGQALMLYNLF